MKFLIENSDKSGKQVRSASTHEEKKKDGLNMFYNILNPSNKIQCDDCKRDVSRSTKILATDCDYCISCFANLDHYPEQYHVINKLDYPLFVSDWTAEEELYLFEALEKHGFGNWAQIADFIGGNKTREDVEEHYISIYLDTPEFLPTVNLISRRDSQGKLIKSGKESVSKKINKKQTKANNISNTPSFQRGSLTVNQMPSTQTSSNPAQIVGFMPKRGDFQVQYDNDAELLLAEMQFNDDDSEEEKKMKFRLIDIYNQKLTERIRRKQFVISRKLLDLKEQMRLDKTRTKEEKQIYNMMKVFARFSTSDEHQKLVQGIIKEKTIRQRLQELKDLKRKGFRTIAEADNEIDNKKKKQQKSKKKDDPYISDKSKTRRMKREMATQKSDKRLSFISQQEEDLCRRYGIDHKQYMMIKETIIRESIRQGTIEKQDAVKIFKLDRVIIEGIFDYLVDNDEITAGMKEYSEE